MFGVQNAVLVLEPRRVHSQVVDHRCSRPLWECKPLALSAYLTRRVDYFGREDLPLIFDIFTKRVFDGGIIALDKMPVHKSYRE